MNKLKDWVLKRLREKSTWLGIIALLSIFGVGAFDPASSDELASALSIVMSAILVAHKEQ